MTVMTDEQWRPVPGRDGYEVSDRGRVRSLLRNPAGTVLRVRPDKAGYPHVAIKQAHDYWMPVAVYRLVATAFFGPRPDGMEVRHLDGDRMNSARDNLAYGTHSENELDKVRHGTHPEARKTRCPQQHEYTEANTYVDRWGRRHCRACRRSRRPERTSSR